MSKPVDHPNREAGQSRQVANMLREEGKSCLADFADGPLLIGTYDWEEPVSSAIAVPSGDISHVRFQYSSFEGEAPPEETWQDFTPDETVTARHWRLWSRQG